MFVEIFSRKPVLYGFILASNCVCVVGTVYGLRSMQILKEEKEIKYLSASGGVSIFYFTIFLRGKESISGTSWRVLNYHVSRAGHSLFFFQVRSPLNFYPWIAITHFADFQVCSSLNRSQKDLWLALRKERLKRLIAPETTAVCSF